MKAFVDCKSFKDALWHRYKHNEDVLVVVDDTKRNGMSASAISLAEQFNRSLQKKKVKE